MVLIANVIFATNHYIATTGDDSTGDGTSGNPWKTLSYACSQVVISGDSIIVGTGTFIETTNSNLSVGVNIIGQGATSVIQANYSAATEFNALIVLRSLSEGTDGNQTISNLKLDGNSLTGKYAIMVAARSNVKIHDCTFIDFSDWGITFSANTDNSDSEPTSYATGNEFYNNIITNCAKYDSGGRGELQIAGQLGILIYDNNMNQSGRGSGNNGWPIKGTGYNEAVKIYNNTLTKDPYDGVTFDFVIELWGISNGGHQIYNNIISGNTDLNDMYKGTYDYSVWFHNNTVGPDTKSVNNEAGFELEGDCENVIIEKNTFKNLDISILFQHSTTKYIKDVHIRYNIAKNARLTSTGGSGTPICRDIYIQNNTLNGASSDGIGIEAIGTYSHWELTNNIITNNTRSSVTFYMASAGATIDSVLVYNNIMYGNGNSDNLRYSGITPTNVIEVSTIKSDPLFTSSTNFVLLNGSPAINAGVDVGLTTDYLGNSIMGLPDIGAYEYQGLKLQVDENGVPYRLTNGKYWTK